MDQGVKAKKEINPKEKANIVSLITFFYTFGLLRKGRKKDLEEEDVYEVLPYLSSKKLGDKLENEWLLENKLRKEPSIARVLFKCFGKRYIAFGAMQFIVKTIMIVLIPFALGRLVKYFTPGQKEISKNDAYIYGSLLIILDLFNAIYQHNYVLAMFDIALRVRTGFCSLIYRKALKLSSTTVADFSMGKIVTLTTKDVNAFDSAAMHANDLWIGVLHFIIIFYLIYAKVGIAALTVVGFFLVLVPSVACIGIKISSLRIESAKKSDERLQITQEVLSAIRIVKMYTWEKFFGQKIEEARKKEISVLLKIFCLKAVSFCSGSLSTQLAFFAMIMTYLWLGNELTADMVYYTSACFHNLKHAITLSIPIGIAQSAEVVATLKRVGNLLKAQELQEVKRDVEGKVSYPRIIITNVTSKIYNVEVLKDICSNIESGLNMLTGSVGSGKTSLLKTILDEYQYTGKVSVTGKVSYASQEPWLFPGTIRQNVIFGEPYDRKRYDKVLTVCALKFDLDILANKDDTIVGDRGVNLSKGQQARINLARAVYKESDIYLLDDCLTSLDSHVQDYIFTECIQGLLRGKLIVFVTHNTNHIKDADNIILLADGKLKSSGKPTEEIEEEINNIVNEELANMNDKNKKNMEAIKNELNMQKDMCLKSVVKKEIDKEKDCLQSVELTQVQKKSDNLYHEEKRIGTVTFDTYKKYFISGGGIPLFTLLLALFISAQVSESSTDKIISKWVNVQQNISDLNMKNMTNTAEYGKLSASNSFSIKLYSILVALTTILTISRSLLHFVFTCKASINIHKLMIYHVVNAVMDFFDKNFIGNILNRFSKDLAAIDEIFPFILYQFIRAFFMIIGVYALIISVNIMFVIPSSIFFLILFGVRHFYIRTGRSLKRLDAATRSPVVGHLNASLEGLTTIRACGIQDKLKDEFDGHQDLYTSAYYMSIVSTRGFSVLLDLVCVSFITIVVWKFLLFDTGTEAGNVGLAITQAFTLTGILQWGIREWAELENYMTSVERALEYVDVKSEDYEGETKENWPSDGNIKYQNVSLTYKKTNETVLKNVSFEIQAQHKIGIVGRTGAGKSSIIATLFRLYDVDGTILIDGVDTKTLPIDFLRSSIAIIPQDPVLFSGTIRNNIDPYNQYSDEEIWKALEIVKLKDTLKGLEDPISESGSNFSSGQRQLICLARAIVRQNKIIVLDEATANMDPETDALLHTTIQKKFTSSTVITIAHRLHSVLDANKVMVMDKGELIEYDSPEVLLQNKDSVFYKLVQQADLPSEKSTENDTSQ